MPSAAMPPPQAPSPGDPLYDELWHACAGPLVTVPRVGYITFYYFNIELKAESDTDKVNAQVMLMPDPGQLKHNETAVDKSSPTTGATPPRPAVRSFCKILTASDTSTHGGFSVLRRHAGECLPPLDMDASPAVSSSYFGLYIRDCHSFLLFCVLLFNGETMTQSPPTQELVAKDLHGMDWRFRHIFHGQPRRHLLQSGWSVFVSSKRLVAGDAFIFLRGESGELRVGVRRAKLYSRHELVTVFCRNLESERPSDTANLALHRSSWIENQGTENSRDDLDGALLELLKTITNSFPEECTSLSGGYGEVYRGVLMAEPITVKKLSNLETLADSFSHQLVQSLMHPTCKYCNPSIIGRFTVITDASCGWRNLHQIIKPNCERSHHSHKNHTGQFSNILLYENLEPRIYDTNVSCPFDQEHIWDSEFISQMDRIWIFSSGASFSSVRNLAVFDGLGVLIIRNSLGVIIIRNSSVRCPLVKMLLPGNEIKVPVSWWSLNQKTRHLKWNVTFCYCSSLLIRIETLTEKKTVANGNGKGADNGSSEEVSSYEANDGLHASTETPMSQIESSISRPDETATVDPDEIATVDISSVAPTRTVESTWYIASAATHHMTGVQDLLTNYTPMSGELDVHTPNMGRMQVFGSGSVNTANITLQDVWHVPGLDVNLVSTSQLTKLGHRVSLGSYGCRINKDSDGALIGSAHFTDDYLFAVDFLNVQPNN